MVLGLSEFVLFDHEGPRGSSNWVVLGRLSHQEKYGLRPRGSSNWVLLGSEPRQQVGLMCLFYGGPKKPPNVT